MRRLRICWNFITFAIWAKKAIEYKAETASYWLRRYWRLDQLHSFAALKFERRVKGKVNLLLISNEQSYLKSL